MNVGVVSEGIALLLFPIMYYKGADSLIITLAVIARLIGGFVINFYIQKRPLLCFSLHFMHSFSNCFLKKLKR